MLGCWARSSRGHRLFRSQGRAPRAFAAAAALVLLAPLAIPVNEARAQQLPSGDGGTTVPTTTSTSAPAVTVPKGTEPAPPPPAETGHDSLPEQVPPEPVAVPPPVHQGLAIPDTSAARQIAGETVEKLRPSLLPAEAARAAAAHQVDALTRELASADARMTTLGAELQPPTARLLEARHRLRQRAVSSYVFSAAAPVNDALEATDIMDLSRRLAMVRSVLRADRARVKDHQAAKDQVSRQIEDLVVHLEHTRSALTAARVELQAAESRLSNLQLQVEAAKVGVELLSGGFLFPVDGPSTFTDSFGAPRMVGTSFAHLHQGTDIFAPAGTPLVAVERGVLARVGTDVLGGTKLWLVGASGTRYFYAHLSALAEGTADGRVVEAGQVVGYVGNSGNAKNTPPHLHFELHPGGGPAVNPFPVLRAVDEAQRRRPPYPAPQLPPATPGPLPPSYGGTPSVPPLAPPGADEAGRRRAQVELEAAAAAIATGRKAEANAAMEVRSSDAKVGRAEAQLAGHGPEHQAVSRRLSVARGRMRDLAVAQYVSGGPVGPTVHALARAGDADEFARRTVLVRSAHALHRSVITSYNQAHQDASRQIDLDTRALEAAKAERETAVRKLGAVDDRLRAQVAELDNRRLLLDLATAAAPVLPSDIPRLFFDAYRKAAETIQQEAPGCGLGWTAIAAVGKIESDHGRFGGTRMALNGDLFPRIVGIPLDGTRTALIRDSDGGALDGDLVHDRAVGPMQFIPSTWNRVARDGNGDGVADSHNAYDAALGAATYLCRAVPTRRLDGEEGLRAAFFAYNHSNSYVETVLRWLRTYDSVAPQLPPALQALA